MESINSVKAKLVFMRVLKVATYCLGFPLLLWLVYNSVAKISGGFMGEAKDALNVLAIAFLVVVLTQIVVGLTMRKKSPFARAVIVVAVAVVMVVAPMLHIEVGVKTGLEKTGAQIKEDGYDYDMPDFVTHAENYESWSNNLKNQSKKFRDTYNLGGGKWNNSDLTPVLNADDDRGAWLTGDRGAYLFGTKNIFTGEEMKGGSYGVNGFYNTGYAFSEEQARYILEVYYGIPKLDGYKNVDQMLEDELEKIRTGKNTRFNAYSKTNEYLRAYGEDPLGDPEAYKKHGEDRYTDKASNWVVFGEITDKVDGEEVAKRYDIYRMHAKHYTIDYDQLCEVIDALFEHALNETALAAAIKNLMKFDLKFLGEGLGQYTLGALLPLIGSVVGIDLTEKGLVNLITGFTGEGADALLQTLGLTRETVDGLLSQFSYYLSPVALPEFYFIDDVYVREYAYARYAGREHGFAMGSMLLPWEGHLMAGSGNVGAITLDNGGNSPMSQGDLNAYFLRQDVETSYMQKYYPWLAARSSLLRFGGLVPLMLALAYAFAAAEKKQFNKLQVKGGVR